MPFIMPVIEPKLMLFRIQAKGLFTHAAELRQATLGEAPEVVDAVDVTPRAPLAAPVRAPQMPMITPIHQPVVAAKPVQINGAVGVHLPRPWPATRLSGGPARFRHIPPIALEYAEHGGQSRTPRNPRLPLTRRALKQDSSTSILPLIGAARLQCQALRRSRAARRWLTETRLKPANAAICTASNRSKTGAQFGEIAPPRFGNEKCSDFS